jgi:hypothetical protein
VEAMTPLATGAATVLNVAAFRPAKKSRRLIGSGIVASRRWLVESCECNLEY